MSALDLEYGDPLHLTFAQYLAWERDQEVRHEYVSGVVYAMAGASYSHNRIATQMTSLVKAAADADDCRVTQSDMAVRIEAVNCVYYPDVMVSCAPLGDEYLEAAPCLIVEVLSPSTQGRDRTIKLAHYSTIPSLQVYLMVSSDPAEPFVIEHRRAGDLWLHRVYDTTETIELSCPHVSFSVSDLYLGVLRPLTES